MDSVADALRNFERFDFRTTHSLYKPAEISNEELEQLRKSLLLDSYVNVSP